MKKDRENKFIIERDRRLRELPEFAYDFISTLDTTLEISTQIEYIKDIHNFLNFLLISETLQYESIENITIQDLGKLTERDIRNFLSYLTEYTKEFKKKDGSISIQKFTNTRVGLSRKISTLHTLYKYLISRKLLLIDPTVNIEVKTPVKIGKFNRLDNDELNIFINTIEDKNISKTPMAKAFDKLLSERDYIIALLLSLTGIRISELVQIDMSDVNIEKGTVLIHRKRNKQQLLDLPFDVLKPLDNYIKSRSLIEKVPSEYKDALFLSLQKKRINDKTVRYALKKYKSRTNISENITPHTLRRSCGTELYNQTGDVRLVGEYLGHSSIDTTRKYYTQVDDNRMRNIIQNFSYSKDEK